MRSRGVLIAVLCLTVIAAALALVAIAWAGRGDDESASTTAPTTSAPTTTTIPDLAGRACDPAIVGQEVGRLQNPTLTEVSGLWASPSNAGVLWAHNDSGGEPAVYAVGTDGADLGAYTLPGAEAVDWEDMAGWTDPATGQTSLYLADIGDNAAGRPNVTVYRVREPVVAGPGGGETAPPEVYALTYPDGPLDAEVFMVEPGTGDFYILTKGWGTGIARVFRAAAPSPGSTVAMEDAGSVNLKEVGSYATAGDVNGIITVRTYGQVVVFPLEGSIAQSLTLPYCVGPSLDEAQGEAVALAADASGYYTVSEGPGAPLNWFPFPP